MSSDLLYFEIFEKFEEANTKEDKIAVLRKNANQRFLEFLNAAFNPDIEFDVQVPDYRKSYDPAGLTMTNLDLEVPKLYRFVKGHPQRAAGLAEKRQQELLLVILESLHKKESELLVGMIHKKLPVAGLTAKLVNEAFPQIYIGE